MSSRLSQQIVRFRQPKFVAAVVNCSTLKFRQIAFLLYNHRIVCCALSRNLRPVIKIRSLVYTEFYIATELCVMTAVTEYDMMTMVKSVHLLPLVRCMRVVDYVARREMIQGCISASILAMSSYYIISICPDWKPGFQFYHQVYGVESEEHCRSTQLSES